MWLFFFSASSLFFLMIQAEVNESYGMQEQLVPSTITHGMEEETPIASTRYGRLRGRVINTKKGNCHVFFGVPFAAPPIGPFRWKKPVPPLPWRGIMNATEFSPRCIQLLMKNEENENIEDQSEDCLYLNIFAPKHKSNSSLPVMVYIHGGGYGGGSAKEMSEDGTCENLATRDVIVVLIQYRLFIYGFLSTGDEAALGNYGLWDQIEALKWVKGNIASFGGDPNRVTIFGESVGASSVSYLTYIRLAQDLFHQSILQSGSAHCRWAELRDISIGTTKKILEAANCSNPDVNQAMNCLRSMPSNDLTMLYKNITDGGSFFGYLSPRADGELFMETTLTEIKSGKPVVIGVNTLEFSVPEASCLQNTSELLEETISGLVGTSGGTAGAVLQEVVKYAYIHSKGDPNNRTFVCEQIYQMQADHAFDPSKLQFGFHVGPAFEAAAKAEANNSVWVYNFDYYHRNLFPADYKFRKAATHAHDACFIFLLKKYPSKSPYFPGCQSTYEGEDEKMAEKMAEMWTNFAKYGNPSPKEITWPRYGGASNANALWIGKDLSIRPTFYLEVTNLWTQLIPNLKRSLAT